MTGSFAGGSGIAGSAPRHRRLAERGKRGAPSEHEALEQRVRREPVCAVHARRGAFAGGIQAGQLAPAVEIGEDAADGVVRGRRHGDRCLRGVVALLDEAPHQRRKATAVDRAEVEQHRSARRDLAGDDIARRELVGEAVALVVEEHRTLASQRLGEEKRRVDERRRMELDELEVGERSARAIGGGHSLADRARRVRRPLPQGCGATGGEKRGARRDRAAVGDDAHAALVVAPHGEHPLALGDLDPRVREHALGELSRHAVAGCSAARVHHATSAVTSFETQAVVELHAELDEVADASRRLLGENGHRARAAEASARAERVLRVKRRVVVLAHGRGDPSLREQAGRGQERPLREDEDIALARGAECREEAGDTATHDDERELATCMSGIAHGSFSL